MNNIQSYQNVAQTDKVSQLARTHKIIKLQEEISNKAGYDTVNFSQASKELGSLPPLLIPSNKNVQLLTEEFSNRLKAAMEKNNIPTDIEFTINDNGEVESDSEYADKIQKLIDESDELTWLSQTSRALASHVVHIAERMQFHEEYAHAKNDREAQYIVNKYSHFFNDSPLPKLDISFNYNGESLNMLVNNEYLDFN